VLTQVISHAIPNLLKIFLSVHSDLVNEHGNFLYKYGDIKLYLGRPWQIIILENF
jgi:hypothetical protein